MTHSEGLVIGPISSPITVRHCLFILVSLILLKLDFILYAFHILIDILNGFWFISVWFLPINFQFKLKQFDLVHFAYFGSYTVSELLLQPTV